MYKALLILKYLRKRRIAWVSLIAVMLCTAMVLVVISVMGGWLRMFSDSFKGISGDIRVHGRSMAGFPHYQEMIDRIGKLPEVKAAAPVITSLGLININNQIREGVQVFGYPANIQEVNGFRNSCYLIGGNFRGALVEAQCAQEILKQPRPYEAALVHKCPHNPATASYGLITPENEFLPFSPRGDQVARAYLGKPDAVPGVRVRATRVVPFAVKSLSTNAGEIEGFVVPLHGAYSAMLSEDPDEAAEAVDAKAFQRDSNYGLVSGDQYYDFDENGDTLAARHAWASIPEIKEGEKQTWRRVRISGQASQPVYEVEAISRADMLKFDLWPHRPYRPPPDYKGTADVKTWGGMIVGAGVIGVKRDRNGNIYRSPINYEVAANLMVVPIDPDSSQVDFETSRVNAIYWIIDDSRTKVHLYDSKSVYVQFEKLQRDLEMDAHDDRPARTSDIQIALKPGADAYAVRKEVERIVDEVRTERGIDLRFPIEVETWDQTHGTFIAAVQNEKLLVTFLFGIISIVAIFLIFCIFYMIVMEKTRDIGIIKSVGATAQGVAAIFLGYGAVIGVIGSLMGLLLSWTIVHNINWIHTQLGKVMGIQVWNPEVYLFDTIPNTMDATEVTVIVAAAIVSSILGALVPALRAARMHPIEALRWE